MVRGRLFFWGYVATMLGSILFGTVVTLTRRLAEDRPARSLGAFLVDGLARNLDDPTRKSAEIARLQGMLSERISLYDPQGTLLATTTTPPLPMIDTASIAQLSTLGSMRIDVETTAHAVIRDGRIVAIGIVRDLRGIGAQVAWSLGPALSLLLGAALFFAQRISRPLGRIASAARRFGDGDLSARSDVQRNDEIGEVGRAFDEMADRVTRLMTAQQELMANVSHELQTPLARMRVAVDLFLDGISQQAMEVLPSISHDLAELERMIDDIMAVSRLDIAKSGHAVTSLPLRLERAALGAIVDTAVSRFRGLHQSHEVVVAVPQEEIAIRADAVLLRRVLDNLLENARKYSEPATRITLRATRDANRIAIEVADEGIGMNEADRERAFTPFFRSDSSRTRSTGGVGLGLALARRIVEAHGGEIAIASELGKGTIVRISLPTI